MEVKIAVVIYGLFNNFFFLPVTIRIGACLSVILPSNATNVFMLVFISLATIEFKSVVSKFLRKRSE